MVMLPPLLPIRWAQINRATKTAKSSCVALTTQEPHTHKTTGACWLKKQEEWDGSTDLAATNLKVNVRGDFTERFRTEHQSAPLTVPWVSGLVKAT